jgi:hypothetical protein
MLNYNKKNCKCNKGYQVIFVIDLGKNRILGTDFKKIEKP